MKWFEFPFALFTIIAIAAVVPPWLYFIQEYGPELSQQAEFLAIFVFPAMLLLFLGSWLEPGGIR